jgi:hypothetical protein
MLPCENFEKRDVLWCDFSNSGVFSKVIERLENGQTGKKQYSVVSH